MDHVELLQAYERKLAEQRWEAVAGFIHQDAVFIFSEGTYRGKAEIGGAFTRTFETIQDETYRIADLEWVLVTDDVAACIYHFHWEGVVNGERMSGGGRGTSILTRTAEGWQIIHEHLGPNPR